MHRTRAEISRQIELYKGSSVDYTVMEKHKLNDRIRSFNNKIKHEVDTKDNWWTGIYTNPTALEVDTIGFFIKK